MSINESFFSEINKDYTFKRIKDIIMSNHSINISLDNSYNGIFNKNMHEIFNKSDTGIITLEQLNNKLIVSTSELFRDKLQKLENNKDIDNNNVDDAYNKLNSLRDNDNKLFIEEVKHTGKPPTLLDGPVIGDNVSYFNMDDKNNTTDISSLNYNNVKEEITEPQLKPEKKINKVKSKKNMKIMSFNRYNYDNSSRYNYKYDLVSNNITFNNNNKIEQIIIPIEDNYIFSSPIIFLKIQELKLNISMKLEDTITNNHRLYGIYYPIENHNLKSINMDNITINITDISETIHNNIDTLKIYQLEISNDYIILHNKYIISDYFVNDYIKLIEYEKNIIDINSIMNIPLKIERIIDNKLFIKNINNVNDLNVNIDLRLINLSNQNIIFIK